MLSWIFRNRRRLRAIYGSVPGPALAGPLFLQQVPPALPTWERESSRPAPGELRRRKQHVLMRPMPRRAG